MLKAKLDMREFNRLARYLKEHTRGAGRNVMRETAKNFVLAATKLTPPFKGKMGSHVVRQTWGMQRKVGMNAIKGDLLGGTRGEAGKTKRAGIFQTMPEALIRHAASNVNDDGTRYWATKHGQVYGVEEKDFNPSGNQQRMREHHRRYFKNGRMTSAGTGDRVIGRWKWVDKMIIPPAALKQYLKYAYAKVFFAKSGWAKAAAALRAKLPQWITRHKGQGVFAQSSRNGWPQFRVGNAVDYIQDTGDDLRILKFALRLTVRKMKRQLSVTMQKNLLRKRR